MIRFECFGVFLALALALPAWGAPAPAALREAAAAARVGDAERALVLLDGATFEGEAAAAAAVVRGKALLRAGRPAEAVAAVAGVSEPALAEPVGLVRLRAAEAAGDRAALARAAAALLALRDPAAATVAEARLQQALSAVEASPDKARRLLQVLAADPPVRAIAPMALGALGALGDRGADRRLLIEFGDTGEGRAALGRMPASELSAADRMKRARRLWEQRAYALAEADFQALADAASDPRAKQEALLRLGTIRQRLRERYEEALALFEQVKAGPDRALADEAQFRVGLVLGYLERWREASAAMLAYLERAPKGPYAVEAGYQVGRLLHQGGLFADAVAAHEKWLATRRPDHGKYVWFLGWSRYRAGDCAGARATWAPYARSRNVLVGAKVLYWTARCLRIEGDEAGARAALAELRRRAPLSYYGLLGAVMAGEALPRVVTQKGPPAPPDLARFEGRLPKAARASLRAARLLTWAGDPRLARRAVDVAKLERAAKKALGAAEAAALSAALVEALELWGEAWRGLPKATQRAPWNEGIARLGDDEARAAYPAAYHTLAAAAGRPHGVTAWWLLPHMLQESRYKEKARSHAGALGPMQVLPRTGRLIAAELGFPGGQFIEDRLFEPGVALRHAAWYLGALRKEFGGNVILAIGAYNGGPLRFAEHLQMVQKLAFDEVIEEIGAHESRNYARKVTDHFVRYLSLYASDAERAEWLAALTPPATVPAPRGEVRF